jgi:pyridoxal 5'-phosphate synthase pdxS subunit
MMQLGAESVFVGSGIFKSENPEKRARAIVEAVTYYDDPEILARISRGLGEPMRGIDVTKLSQEELLQTRGW